MVTQLGLFGEDHDIFQSAKERYGVWPTTVWNVDHSDRIYHRLKAIIGDQGEARQECFTRTTNDRSTYRGKVTESIFNPQVAIWLMNCFAPNTGQCFDPFGGGGTRAIIATKHGLNYTGIEIRQSEVQAVVERCQKVGVKEKVNIIHGDAREAVALTGQGWADFLITCPPYWNLEKYSGGPSDLSMLPTYASFLEQLEVVISQSYQVLKQHSLSIWIVGLHRDNERLLPLNHDISTIHQRNGFILREEIILSHKNNGAIQRVGNFEKGKKLLVRTHEYALVFRKKAK